jgi:HSP20 family protein
MIMANITRNDPLGEMVSLRSAMDRLFQDSFVNPVTWRTISGGEAISPATDVHEDENELVVTAALPGIKPEDVDITITGQTLTLRGEFKEDEDVKREQYLYRERRFGSFSRTIELPVRVQGERAEATFSDGVLKLTIPKAEEVKPRQIKVSATGNGGKTAVETKSAGRKTGEQSS